MNPNDAKAFIGLSEFVLSLAEIQIAQGNALASFMEKTAVQSDALEKLDAMRDQIFQRRTDVPADFVASFDHVSVNIARIISEGSQASLNSIAQLRDQVARMESNHEKIGAVLEDLKKTLS